MLKYVLLLLFVLFAIVQTACNREKGCTDVTALNYNPEAMIDNGTCLFNLPTPSVYQFFRTGQSTVNYREQIVVQLLISDILHIVEQLATPAAQLENANLLTSYYETNNLSLPILSIEGLFTADNTTFNSIQTGVQLNSYVDNTYNADSIINNCITQIISNANTSVLGSDAVYTTIAGVNLLAILETTLLGAVLYANGQQALNTVADQSNTAFVSAQNYTQAEQTWDEAFGYWGMSIDRGLNYTNTSLVNTPYFDYDLSGSISLQQEFNYSFSQLAAQRDAIGEDTDFGNSTYSSFLAGRAHTTNRTDSLQQFEKNNIESNWQALIAASCVHHVNALKIAMETFGTPSEDIAAINLHWSYLLGFLRVLQYSNNLLLINLSAWMAAVGEAPPYLATDTELYTEYIDNLNALTAQIQQDYGFTDNQILLW